MPLLPSKRLQGLSSFDHRALPEARGLFVRSPDFTIHEYSRSSQGAPSVEIDQGVAASSSPPSVFTPRARADAGAPADKPAKADSQPQGGKTESQSDASSQNNSTPNGNNDASAKPDSSKSNDSSAKDSGAGGSAPQKSDAGNGGKDSDQASAPSTPDNSDSKGDTTSSPSKQDSRPDGPGVPVGEVLNRLTVAGMSNLSLPVVAVTRVQVVEAVGKGIKTIQLLVVEVAKRRTVKANPTPDLVVEVINPRVVAGIQLQAEEVVKRQMPETVEMVVAVVSLGNSPTAEPTDPTARKINALAVAETSLLVAMMPKATKDLVEDLVQIRQRVTDGPGKDDGSASEPPKDGLGKDDNPQNGNGGGLGGIIPPILDPITSIIGGIGGGGKDNDDGQTKTKPPSSEPTRPPKDDPPGGGIIPPVIIDPITSFLGPVLGGGGKGNDKGDDDKDDNKGGDKGGQDNNNGDGKGNGATNLPSPPASGGGGSGGIGGALPPILEPITSILGGGKPPSDDGNKGNGNENTKTTQAPPAITTVAQPPTAGGGGDASNGAGNGNNGADNNDDKNNDPLPPASTLANQGGRPAETPVLPPAPGQTVSPTDAAVTTTSSTAIATATAESDQVTDDSARPQAPTTFAIAAAGNVPNTLFSTSTSVFVSSTEVPVTVSGIATISTSVFTGTLTSVVPISTVGSAASSGNTKSTKTAAMAGGIAGALILVAALVGLFIFLRKRRQINALYTSSRPTDVENAPRGGAPVFSMVAPSNASGIPSIVVDAPAMAQVAPVAASHPVHKKPAPSLTENELAEMMGSSKPAPAPTSYVLDVDIPTMTTQSMVFDKTTFGQSLEQNASWTGTTANPFADPANPFADPKPEPTTRVSQMPEIPRHLRMSTTSSALGRERNSGNISPTSTIYHDGFAM
ncbi:hypothetical protein MKEN_01277100 [Mycena kentingensis (nom. inval.)]|nr:hypothetical protein MKEN_01277100 [Mycena kentingensis (nom. inval.)]